MTYLRVSVVEPLDLDYEGKIVGRVDQERDQSLAVRAEGQGAQGGGVGRFVGVALVFGGSTITTASMNCAKAFLAVWLKLANSRPAGPSSSHWYTRQTPYRSRSWARLTRSAAGGGPSAR